jgi:plastocyanin
MRKLFVAPIAAAALIVALVVAIPASGATKGVSVKDNFFSPKTASIKKGSTVKWTWAGRAPHNVTFKSTKSKTITKGTFSLKFNNKGSFSYRCTIHPGMTGTIKVT